MTPAVPRLWPSETVVCIASGPSLTAEDVDFVRGKAKVIAINANYQIAPWADVLYAADENIWRWYKGAREFAGMKYSLTKTASKYGVTVLRVGDKTGLSLDPTTLNRGWNSGYQAINLAVHFGASRILLLGYDMQRGLKGKEHWHADHPSNNKADYARFQAAFPTLVEPLAKLGVSIVNCSRTTALTCFPQMPIEQALAAREVAA